MAFLHSSVSECWCGSPPFQTTAVCSPQPPLSKSSRTSFKLSPHPKGPSISLRTSRSRLHSSKSWLGPESPRTKLGNSIDSVASHVSDYPVSCLLLGALLRRYRLSRNFGCARLCLAENSLAKRHASPSIANVLSLPFLTRAFPRGKSLSGETKRAARAIR